jgi:hypothetical protein
MDLTLDAGIGFVGIDNMPCVGSGEYQATTIPNLSLDSGHYVVSWDFPRHDKVYAAMFTVDNYARVIFKTSFTFKLPCGVVTYALLNKFKLDTRDLEIVDDSSMINQILLEYATVTTFEQARVPISIIIERDEINQRCYITRVSCSIPRNIGDEWYSSYIAPTKQIIKS